MKQQTTASESLIKVCCGITTGEKGTQIKFLKKDSMPNEEYIST